MGKISVLHGPNLNLLGSREPEHYGSMTLNEIDQLLSNEAKQLGHELASAQFNAEHEFVDFIQQAPDQKIDFIIINPAAFTHTSVAIRDALVAVGIPFIEVHLSNIYKREPFRHHSYFSDAAVGVISGFGAQSYQLALQAADKILNKGM